MRAMSIIMMTIPMRITIKIMILMIMMILIIRILIMMAFIRVNYYQIITESITS